MKTFKIGRERSCDIWCDDNSVSDFHAELTLTESNKLFLIDCASKFGSFVFRSKQWTRLTQDFIDLDEWVRFGDLEMRGTDLLLQIRGSKENRQNRDENGAGFEPTIVSGPVRRNEFGEPIRKE